jgi:hypothetical protein
MKFFQHLACYLDFTRAPALKIAQDELEEAKRGLLGVAANREYYAAMENMMIERAERLRAMIEELKQEGEK